MPIFLYLSLSDSWMSKNKRWWMCHMNFKVEWEHIIWKNKKASSTLNMTIHACFSMSWKLRWRIPFISFINPNMCMHSQTHSQGNGHVYLSQMFLPSLICSIPSPSLPSDEHYFPRPVMVAFVYNLNYLRSGPGTREKVSSRIINLECNTYVQESNASKLSV
jgi:hypothetical protein